MCDRVVEKPARVYFDHMTEVNIISNKMGSHHVLCGVLHGENPTSFLGGFLLRKHSLSLVIRKQIKDHSLKWLACERQEKTKEFSWSEGPKEAD